MISSPMGHKTKKIYVNGKFIDVDEKIAGLIWELNNAGLVTDYSCQGNKGLDRFISIDLDSIDFTAIVNDDGHRSLVIRWIVDE